MKKTARQLQAENTKRRIFEAATQLLSERDFDSIKIRDIVERAQISIGTFYHHYDSKMDVYYETYQIADEYFEEHVAPKVKGPNTLENLRIFFDCYALYNTDLTDFKMTRLLYNPDNQYFNRPRSTGIVHVLAGILQRGLERGELVCDTNVDDMCDFFMIAMRGLVYPWCTTNCAYDLSARMRIFLQRLVRTYLPPSALR